MLGGQGCGCFFVVGEIFVEPLRLHKIYFLGLMRLVMSMAMFWLLKKVGLQECKEGNLHSKT